MKLALIGCRGHWGYVLRELKNLPEIEPVAISSGCEDPVESMAETLRCWSAASFRSWDDYREMLDAEKPELVSIDGPFDRHAEMCVEALNRGIHVFCEKPISLTPEGLEEIREAHRRSGGARIISMVGLRGEAPFLTAFRAVESGAVGKVKMVNARKSYKLGERPAFFRSRSTYGGTIPWVGSHALDWILWFSGAGFREIAAFHRRDDNHGFGDLEVSAEISCEMQNGVLGGASIDYLRPACPVTHGDDRVRVAGTEGVIEVARGVVTLVDGQGERELPLLPGRGIFYDFVRSLVGGEAPLVDSEATFELTRACLAARADADRRETNE